MNGTEDESIIVFLVNSSCLLKMSGIGLHNGLAARLSLPIAEFKGRVSASRCSTKCAIQPYSHSRLSEIGTESTYLELANSRVVGQKPPDASKHVALARCSATMPRMSIGVKVG